MAEVQDQLKEEEIRAQKLQRIVDAGIAIHPDRFEKEATLAACKDLNEGDKIQTAGRIVLMRDMGKLCFIQLQDITGRMQISLQVGVLEREDYKFFVKNFDLGDFVGVSGEVYITRKGEKTIQVEDYTFLGKAHKPMPGKWHGLEDQEVKYRKRYLDLIANEETRDRFRFRSNFIRTLREFYWAQGFDDVETPVLCNAASGALAKPFKTHHNALDIDVFLRIAPETYLKECIVGGYDKVFEIGRVFRNEGIDPSHLQDFTMVEHYSAYWNFEDNMKFTRDMFAYISENLLGSTKVEIPGRDGEMQEIDFGGEWPVVSFRDLILNDANIDIDQYPTVEELREVIKSHGIEIDDIDVLGRGNLIDSLYKKVSRPHIIQPTFVINHPLDLSPLARKNDDNPEIVDRFQLVINTWEVVNAYSELVDPIDQEARFESQASSKADGDEEAHGKDDEYIDAMKYGMPPISGWGMGIDRIVSLLTGQMNLRDVTLFPLMRPKSQEANTNETELDA